MFTDLPLTANVLQISAAYRSSTYSTEPLTWKRNMKEKHNKLIQTKIAEYYVYSVLSMLV